MYKRDVAIISDHAAASPEGLIDVVEFVLCTIQAGLSTVKIQRLDIAATGLSSRFLWGKKAEGLAYMAQATSLEREGAKPPGSNCRCYAFTYGGAEPRNGEGFLCPTMYGL